MAVLEVKSALTTMLQQFSFSMIPNQDLEVTNALTIGMSHGFYVKLHPRKT